MQNLNIFLLMTMISYFIISNIKQFIVYPAFITRLQSLFMFFRHGKIFIKMPFYYFCSIIILFHTCFNKFIYCVFFSAVKSNWLPTFIINQNKFESKTAMNVFLILFSVWSINFSITSNLFKNRFIISIIFR